MTPRAGANATITVDLENQEISGPDGGVIHFDIDPFLKRCLMEGLDDIGLTMEKADAIARLRGRGENAPALGLKPRSTRTLVVARLDRAIAVLPAGTAI